MILLFFWLELGLDSQNFLNNMEYKSSFYEKNIYLKTDMKIKIFKYFFISGSAKIDILKPKKEFYFFPQQLTSIIGIGIELKNVIFGFEHSCLHPILPYNNIYNGSPIYEGTYTKIYIKIGGYNG